VNNLQASSSYRHGAFGECAHAPCLYTANWPEDGSLEAKHVANCVLMIIYIYFMFEQITLSYCTTQRDVSYTK